MDRQIEELLAFYALDALNDEEKELVEAYLKEHPEARQQVEEMGRAVSALPYGVPPVEPAPHSKEALMRRVAADQRAASSTKKQPPSRAGCVLKIFSVHLVWAPRQLQSYGPSF